LLLTELPDPCLLAVLQYCAADDMRSVFNAARAHSTLHQAALVALRRIWLNCTQQHQADGVLTYLSKHGPHVDSVYLTGQTNCAVAFRHLPSGLQLSSLQFFGCGVQLQRGNGFAGVLGAAAGLAALKKFDFGGCVLLDSNADQALAAALSQLPAGLEHLSMYGIRTQGTLPTAGLHRLQQLTYLSLKRVGLQGPDEVTPVLQPLQASTRLVDLQLDLSETRNADQISVTASMLSGMDQLTQLGVSGGRRMALHCHMAAQSHLDGSIAPLLPSGWRPRLGAVEAGVLAGNSGCGA
jgi:hypothetical protein